MALIRIGTRSSELAMAQTKMAVNALRSAHPALECEIVPIVTKGDDVKDKPLSEIGGRGVFVAEIESALCRGEIDIAVHSAKDLPLVTGNGTEIKAVLKRGDPGDVLVTLKGKSFEENDEFTAGTGSSRRINCIGRLYPNSVCRNIRGNIDTRLNKLYSGEYDAVILAAAGLERLGLFSDERFSFRRFETKEFIPSPCQGIIAVQCRKESDAAEYLEKINDEKTFMCFETEREVLRLLNAGCTTPIGAYSEIKNGRITLSVTADSIISVSGTADIGERFTLAERLVNIL